MWVCEGQACECEWWSSLHPEWGESVLSLEAARDPLQNHAQLAGRRLSAHCVGEGYLQVFECFVEVGNLLQSTVEFSEELHSSKGAPKFKGFTLLVENLAVIHRKALKPSCTVKDLEHRGHESGEDEDGLLAVGDFAEPELSRFLSRSILKRDASEHSRIWGRLIAWLAQMGWHAIAVVHGGEWGALQGNRSPLAQLGAAWATPWLLHGLQGALSVQARIPSSLLWQLLRLLELLLLLLLLWGLVVDEMLLRRSQGRGEVLLIVEDYSLTLPRMAPVRSRLTKLLQLASVSRRTLPRLLGDDFLLMFLGALHLSQCSLLVGALDEVMWGVKFWGRTPASSSPLRVVGRWLLRFLLPRRWLLLASRAFLLLLRDRLG